MNISNLHCKLRKHSIGILTATALLIASLFTAHADNPSTGTTSQGQQLNIQIDESVRDTVSTPGQAFTVNGNTSIGTLTDQANVLYVVDVSGSTNRPIQQDCDDSGTVDDNDNSNGQGPTGDTLDCEISGVLALNNSLASTTGIAAGVIAFGSSAAVADVSPANGEQVFTSVASDQDTNGQLDIDEVARSLTQGRINQFSAQRVGTNTSFDRAIEAINKAFIAAGGGTNIAFFLSDGKNRISTSDTSPLAAAKAAGTIINTYSVGTTSSGCEDGADLRTIADETGGACLLVEDPTRLQAVLAGTAPAGIERVEVTAGVSGVISTTLLPTGNWSANIPVGVVQFPLTITATVYADDGTAVTADIIIDPPAPTSLELSEEPFQGAERQGILPHKIFVPILR